VDFLTTLSSATPKVALELLQSRFAKNHHFFKTHRPQLLPLIERKSERYHLHIANEGLNIVTNDQKFIFPIRDGKSTLFEASKAMVSAPDHNPNITIHFNQTGLHTIHHETLPLTQKAMNTLSEGFLNDTSYNPNGVHLGERFLPTTTMLGLLSGLQLEYFLHLYPESHALLIYEPEPDFFLISCFFVDWEALFEHFGNDKLFLIVTGHLSFEIVKGFYAAHLLSHNYIRVEMQNYDHPLFKDAKSVLETMHRQNQRGWGTVDDEIYGVHNRLKNISPTQPHYPILSHPNPVQTPIAVVGNGPSLEGLLPFLKANQERLIIFSAGTALKPLLKAGIRPDFQIEIERRDHVAGVLNAAPIGDIPLIAADIIHPTTLEAAKECYLFVRPSTASTSMNKPRFVTGYASPLVGNAAASLALDLSDCVYLCGTDVGFKDERKQHASNSFYDDRDDRSLETFQTRGNFSTNVYTNSLFSLSREHFESAFSSALNKQVYNLSDGAYIKGAKPLKAEDASLPKTDKAASIAQLKSTFSHDAFLEPHQRYEEEIERYLTHFIQGLKNLTVTSRKTLYEAIDAAYFFTLQQRYESPMSGTLLSGTLWHLLNTLLVALMHLKTPALDEAWRRGVQLLEQTLKEIKNELVL